MELFQSDILINLTIAMILGMVIGLERFVAHKTADMRTYALVSMGAALFSIVSQTIVNTSPNHSLDPLYVTAQIVAAAGFLGVGSILRSSDGKASGITTATGLWVAAGIGLAVGFELYNLAIAATILTLFIFIVLWFIEQQIRKVPFNRDDEATPL